MRLDEHLHQNGYAESRARAGALVMAGLVYIDGQKADKPGLAVPKGAEIEVRGQARYASRGGQKLAKALEVFSISLRGKTCMDIGASTGGFTDCMLQNGARKVYAVDVAYGMLAWKLRCDERVVNMERTNIRHLEPAALPEKIDFFSIDVSFISLKAVLPVVFRLTAAGAGGVCLVKPQFEAEKHEVGEKGVVREAATHEKAIHAVQAAAVANGFAPQALSFSPIKGPEGNIEFLLYLHKAPGTALPAGFIRAAVQDAHGALPAQGEEQP